MPSQRLRFAILFCLFALFHDVPRCFTQLQQVGMGSEHWYSADVFQVYQLLYLWIDLPFLVFVVACPALTRAELPPEIPLRHAGLLTKAFCKRPSDLLRACDLHSSPLV